MKAKEKFIKMFNALPEKARVELVYNYAVEPMSMNVIYGEIIHDTKIGKLALKRLGYKGDKK